jgi:hypothetical protein
MSGIVHLLKNKFDKALDKQASENYKLSIRVSIDGFSFCIFDIQRNKFAALADWDFQGVYNTLALRKLLNELLPMQEWLLLPYQQTRIIIENSTSTLIPKPLFSEANIHDYLMLNVSDNKKKIIKYDALSLLEAVNIFTLHPLINEILTDYFKNASIHHHSSALIQTLLLMNKNISLETGVFVHVRKSNFDIVIIRNNNLIFFNSFHYQSREDFIYYLIFVLEQLNLNPEETHVVLLGNVSKISDVYEITYKYIRRIGFGKRDEKFEYSYVFDDIPAHYYFTLLHLTHCEL